jgi:hypothetical protein
MRVVFVQGACLRDGSWWWHLTAAGTRGAPDPDGSGGHEPSNRSAAGTAPGPREQHLWIPPASTANSSSSASRSPPRPSGRSQGRRGSTRHPSAPVPPGPHSPLPSTDHRRRRLLRNDHVGRRPPLRPGGHRTCHPPGPRPGRHRPSHRRLGDPDGPVPAHGPRGRRMPGDVPDPGPRRKVPGVVRRDPRRRRDHRRPQWRSEAPNELDHGTRRHPTSWLERHGFRITYCRRVRMTRDHVRRTWKYQKSGYDPRRVRCWSRC